MTTSAVAALKLMAAYASNSKLFKKTGLCRFFFACVLNVGGQPLADNNRHPSQGELLHLDRSNL